MHLKENETNFDEVSKVSKFCKNYFLVKGVLN